MSQYNPQYDQWSAGKSAYEDRLAGDQENLMDRQSDWSDYLMSEDYSGDMAPIDRQQAATWAVSTPEQLSRSGMDYSEQFGASDYGMSDLERQRQDTMSQRDAYWKWQQDLQDLHGRYGDW